MRCRANAKQHDKDKDGYLTKDEVIQLSESLLVSMAFITVLIFSSYSEMSLVMCISRRYPSSSSTPTNSAMPIRRIPVRRMVYPMEIRIRLRTLENDQTRLLDLTICPISVSCRWRTCALAHLTSDLATFRMVVLADELLEGFFGHDLAASFQLDKSADEDYHQTHQKPEGLLGGLMNLVVTTESACASTTSFVADTLQEQEPIKSPSRRFRRRFRQTRRMAQTLTCQDPPIFLISALRAGYP